MCQCQFFLQRLTISFVTVVDAVSRDHQRWAAVHCSYLCFNDITKTPVRGAKSKKSCQRVRMKAGGEGVIMKYEL